MLKDEHTLYFTGDTSELVAYLCMCSSEFHKQFVFLCDVTACIPVSISDISVLILVSSWSQINCCMHSGLYRKRLLLQTCQVPQITEETPRL